MDGVVFKGDEYAKVVLAPVPCDAHVGILDVLEDRAHIGEHAVALGLSVPFVEQSHVSHIDGGDTPGAVTPCLEKFVGAAHKHAGSIETRERIDAFGDGALRSTSGMGRLSLGTSPPAVRMRRSSSPKTAAV